LRWKLVLANKNQNGWPGFIAPFENRYLNKLVVIETQPTFNYPNNPVTTRTQEWVTDRLTGAIASADGNANADADFPYGDTLTQQPGTETWTVTETSFTHWLNNGYFVIITTVTLSNPYTLTQLDTDTNALLSSVSILNMPWNTLIVVPSADQGLPLGPYSPNGDLTQLLPPQVTYNLTGAPGPIAVPNLNAAAWCIYAPGSVSSQNFFPNGYSKLIGYIAMAGNYCQKTYYLDYNLNLLNQNCVSGIGSCAAPFKVTPPPITPGTDAYVLIVPNCQCSG
jgi:hypothetical protein